MIEKWHERTNGPVFKVVFALVSLSFVLGGIGGGLIGGNNSAVKINGEEVSQQAFNNLKKQKESQLNQQLGAKFWDLMDTPDYAKAFNQGILDNLINDELLRQYAQNLKLGISAEQIKAEIVNSPYFQQDGKFNNDLYLNTLRNSGLTAEGYANVVREGLLFSQIQEGIVNSDFNVPAQQNLLAKLLFQQRQIRLAIYPLTAEMQAQTVSPAEMQTFYEANKTKLLTPEKLTVEYVSITPKEVATKVQVTDEQIQTYYDKNLSDFTTQGEARLAHIQVADEKEAQAIEQAVRNGEDFAKLAEQKSADKLSASQGGDLGWAKAGVFPAAFEQTAAKLAVGQVSQPVKVDGAYHIIKVLERKEATTIPLAQVKEQIAQIVRKELELTEYANTIREMANKAFENTTSLAEVAKVAGVSVQKTEAFTRDNVPAVLKNDKILNVLFEGELRQNGQNSEGIDLSEGDQPRTMFVRVSDYQPEREKTLDEAKAQIETMLKREKAEKSLTERAEQQLKALNAGKTEGVTFGGTQNLVYLQALAEQPLLTPTVFAMSKPTGKPTYQVARNRQGDVLIVALDKVVDGNPEQFKAVEAGFARANQENLRQNLLQDLRSRASIDVNQDFLDQNLPNSEK